MITAQQVLGFAGLFAGGFLLFEAQKCFRNGEFQFSGRLRSTPPILRSERPTLFWAMVGAYAVLGLLALATAPTLF